MNEPRYEVYAKDELLASQMTLPMVFAFIKGYANQFFNERINLTVKEMFMPEVFKPDDLNNVLNRYCDDRIK